MMFFQILMFVMASLSVPSSANINSQVMNQSFIEKQAIFTNFPKLSDISEKNLSTCFESLLSNSQWLSCLAQLDDDSCICEVYQLANENCIKKYINDAEYINVFTTTVKESCNFGIEKNKIDGVNRIADYEDSDNLSILSSPGANLPKQIEGYLDFCCKEFQNCYEDVKEKFDTCSKEVSDASQNGQTNNCKCKFAKEIKNDCFQYCPKKEKKFDKIIQKLCITI